MGLAPVATLSHPILADAQQFAESLLPKQPTSETSSSSSVNVYHHHYYESPGLWWWHRPSYQTTNVYVNNDSCSTDSSWSTSSRSCSSKSKNEDKENGTAALIMLMGTVVVVVGSFFVGAELARRDNISKHHASLQTQEWGVLDHPHREKLMHVLKLEHEILDKMDSEAATGVMTKGALVASAGTAALGAFLDGAASPFVKLGLIGGVISAAAILGRWGYSLADNSRERDANHLLNTIGLVDGLIKA